MLASYVALLWRLVRPPSLCLLLIVSLIELFLYPVVWFCVAKSFLWDRTQLTQDKACVCVPRSTGTEWVFNRIVCKKGLTSSTLDTMAPSPLSPVE